MLAASELAISHVDLGALLLKECNPMVWPILVQIRVHGNRATEKVMILPAQNYAYSYCATKDLILGSNACRYHLGACSQGLISGFSSRLRGQGTGTGVDVSRNREEEKRALGALFFSRYTWWRGKGWILISEP